MNNGYIRITGSFGRCLGKLHRLCFEMSLGKYWWAHHGQRRGPLEFYREHSYLKNEVIVVPLLEIRAPDTPRKEARRKQQGKQTFNRLTFNPKSLFDGNPSNFFFSLYVSLSFSQTVCHLIR